MFYTGRVYIGSYDWLNKAFFFATIACLTPVSLCRGSFTKIKKGGLTASTLLVAALGGCIHGGTGRTANQTSLVNIRRGGPKHASTALQF